MGLLDVLTGMQNGPRGQMPPGAPSADSSSGDSRSSGSMSPLTMALIGLLAYKAIKSFGGQGAQGAGEQPAGTGRPSIPLPDGTRTASSTSPASPAGPASGGLSDLMKGGLGGLLAGGAAGSVLGGGLSDIIKQLQQSGHGEVADSWVGTGPNKTIAPNDLAHALGSEEINTLSQQSGMSRDELIAGLSQRLPELVDKLTPNGRLPSERDWSRWL